MAGGGAPGHRAALSEIARLATLLLLLGLSTSRLTLVAHELVGHGGGYALAGCTVVELRLSLFGGGWVHGACPHPLATGARLVVSLGGIGVQLLAGGAALLLARVGGPTRREADLTRIALVAYALMVLVHAGHYLAAGSFHGYGDGAVLYELLGPRRLFVSMAAALGVVFVTWLLGAELTLLLRARMAPGSARRQLTILILSALTAADAHAGLTFGEQRVAPEPRYQRIGAHAAAREIELALARYRRDALARAGREPTAAELETERRALERAHRRPPFGPALAAAVAVAFAGGALRAARRAPSEGGRGLAWRDLLPVAMVCAASLLAVLAHELLTR
jgi:hypothetical protein